MQVNHQRINNMNHINTPFIDNSMNSRERVVAEQPGIQIREHAKLMKEASGDLAHHEYG